MKKKNRKVNTPKIYLVGNVIHQYKLDDSISKEFLQNSTMQNQFFAKPKMLIDDILVQVWLCRYAERDLIEKKLITEDHSFFNRVIKLIDANEKLQKEMYEFLTMMYFEDNSICDHWNFQHKITQSNLDQIICKSISQNYKSLDLFIDNLGKERVEKVRFNWENNPKNEPLDIKTMALMNCLKNWGTAKRNFKLLINDIDIKLNIPYDYELLFRSIDKKSIFYYDLQKLEMPNLNQYVIEHEFDKIKIKTTIENMSKYNSMDKGLSACMYGQEAYDLNGEKYTKEHFDDLVNSFYQDPFLKKTIVNYMLGKSAKAVKAENKSYWNYYAVKLDIDNDLKINNEGKSKKIVKV
jgi:hypothetical protein